MRELSAWDLLREVGEAEGLDVAGIVRGAEAGRIERDRYRRDNAAAIYAAEVAAMEPSFVYADDGTVLSPHMGHDRGECPVCDTRREAMDRVDA